MLKANILWKNGLRSRVKTLKMIKGCQNARKCIQTGTYRDFSQDKPRLKDLKAQIEANPQIRSIYWLHSRDTRPMDPKPTEYYSTPLLLPYTFSKSLTATSCGDALVS